MHAETAALSPLAQARDLKHGGRRPRGLALLAAGGGQRAEVRTPVRSPPLPFPTTESKAFSKPRALTACTRAWAHTCKDA